MKNKLWLFLVLAISIAACSSGPDKDEKQAKTAEAHPRIESFIQEWSEDMPQEQQQKYTSNYKEYLKSVKEIYTQNGRENDFDYHLKSLKRNSFKLSDFEDEIAQKYRQQKNRTPSAENRDFQLFKTQMMTKKFDELNRGREKNLKEKFGKDFYTKLRDNYINYKKNTDGQVFLFPI